MATSAPTKKAFDLEVCFSSAGYSLFAFTPAEQKAISAKIEKLRHEGKPEKQAIAIAISMIAPSKAKGEAEGSFSAVMADAPRETPKIKIKGGDYRWTDTKDGYKVVYDVPLMAAIKKDTKGAPYDVDRSELEHYVRVALTRYHEDHFLPTVFVDHNKDLEFQKPVFAGYVLPRRVADVPLENEKGERVPTPTVMGDLKLKNEFFEKVQGGEFPYHSPELPWAKRRISGLALLNTKPPFFEFPNFTIGQEMPDGSSEFGSFEGARMNDIKREPIGRFDGDADADASDVTAGMKKLMGRMDAMEAKYAAHMSAFEKFQANFAAFTKKFDGEAGKVVDTRVDTDSLGENKGAVVTPGTTAPVLKGKAEGEGDGEAEGSKKHRGTFARGGESPKVTPLPVEPTPGEKPAVAALSAEFIARFAASESRLKVLEEERAKEKDELLKRSRLDWAKDELKGKVVADTTMALIGQFALDETLFKATVAEMKKALPDVPPSSMADFKGKAVDVSAKSVAQFAQQGPEAASMAAKFAADYRMFQEKTKTALSMSEEDYVKFRMEDAKTARLSA